jgi:hypothetical protein
LARFAALKADPSGDKLRDDLEAMAANDAKGADRIPNLLGYRKKNAQGLWEWWVLPAAWRDELCLGFNPKLVAEALAGRGLLIRENDGKHLTRRLRLAGTKRARFYCLGPAILEGDEADEDQGGDS